MVLSRMPFKKKKKIPRLIKYLFYIIIHQPEYELYKYHKRVISYETKKTVFRRTKFIKK